MFMIRLFEEGSGPNAELAWLLYAAFGFFALMVLVGWLVSRKPAEKQPAAKATVKKPGARKEADDLAIIEGIGPKVVKVLAGIGITTFAGLAAADPARISAALQKAGLRMMDPSGWIEQARLAARGDWAGFEKLTRELKGGRRVK